MIKEYYTTRTRQVSISIVDSEVESVRKSDIQKTGCRVYANGYIGVAGGIGTVDREELEKEAIANLDLHIPYEETVEKDYKEYRDRRELEFDEADFMKRVKKILYCLRMCYPEYVFNNRITMQETCVTLSNDQGLDLVDRDLTIEIALVIRQQSSANIFDTFAGSIHREWDVKKMLVEVENTIGSYHKKLELPREGKIPVILEKEKVEWKLIKELNGESVGKGSSLFSQYIGKKIFNEAFTYSQDMNDTSYHTPFFDAEGKVNKDYKYNLIESGVIVAPYTDKEVARVYGYAHTGSSETVYDGVPTLALPSTAIKHSGKSLKELLNGEVGILVVMASGGDYTPDGHFATPVQHAILTDGEQMLGRLPLINVSSNLYDMFGDDYRGYTKEPVICNNQVLVIDMHVRLA